MKGSEEIDNSKSFSDSRDVIARIEYLRDDLNGLCEAVNDAEGEEEKEAALDKLSDWLGCPVDGLPANLDALSDLKKRRVSRRQRRSAQTLQVGGAGESVRGLRRLESRRDVDPGIQLPGLRGRVGV